MKKLKSIQKKIRKAGLFSMIAYAFATGFYVIATPIYHWFLKTFSTVKKDWMLFYSMPSYADNGKVLYEYIRDTYGDRFTYIWLIHREDEKPEIPGAKVYYANSYKHWKKNLRTEKYMMCSKYLIFTHSLPIQPYKKRPDQLIVNLWHGCGYKDIQKSKVSFHELNPFDLALVPGPVFVETKEKFWQCKKECIEPLGYPRYDLMKKPDKKAEDFAKTLRGEAKKLLIWMPTFRQSGQDKFPEEQIAYSFDLSLIASEEEFEGLNEYLKENRGMLLIKRHPKQLKYSCEGRTYSNIRFLSNEDFLREDVDLYAFLQYTDGLISDYSSITIDYMLLNKPMAFALDDFDAYAGARGFVFEDPKAYMPGAHLYSYEDLRAFIRNVLDEKDPDAEKRKEIMDQVHTESKNYCETICNKIMEYSKNDKEV